MLKIEITYRAGGLFRALGSGVALLLAIAVTPAQAQICLHPPSPQGLPGLSGVPQWPASTTDAPALDPTFRNLVSDARWGDAPFEALYPVGAAGNPDSAHYRIMLDRTTNKLTVSIQSQDGSGATTTADFAYFGLADQTAQYAWGVRLALDGSGPHVPVDVSTPTTQSYKKTPCTTGNCWSASLGLPGWISNVSVWVSAPGSTTAVSNGAATVVQFVVDLSQLVESNGVSLFADHPASVMLGMEYDLGGTLGRPGYSTPDINTCGGMSGCTFGSGGLPIAGAGASNFPTNPFLDNLGNWTPISSIGSACSGISIDPSLIGASQCTAAGTTGESNCVQKGASVKNTFLAKPAINAVTNVRPGDLRATFNMSNWGSVAQPTDWLKLGVDTGTDLNTALNDGTVNATCSNADATRICDQVITFANTTTPGKRFHQCLQVQLSTSPSATHELPFQKASAYINTRFEPASLIDAPAEINIKGIPDTLPSSSTRDVYLHVVSMNMPLPAANPISLPISSLEALRAQLDPNFNVAAGGCPNQTDKCYDYGNNYGVCASPCTGRAANTCNAGYAATTLNNQCICVSNSNPEPYCTYTAAPAGGGYDPTKSALTPAQTLDSQYPTLMVYPYYDAQQTVTINGVSRKRLVAMPTFGIRAWHQGTFYGWLNGLVDSSGKPLPQVAPNIYKLSVSKATGIADIDVLVNALQQPHYDALTDIAGTAVLGSGWGLFQLTATAHTSAIDLTKAKLTLQSLLNDKGKELVSSAKVPVTLTPLRGATRTLATFASASLPGATVTVTNLPLIGYVINFTIPLATVGAPSSCPLFFGTATLTTQMALSDGTNPTVTLQGNDTWVCAPGVLLNY